MGLLSPTLSSRGGEGEDSGPAHGSQCASEQTSRLPIVLREFRSGRFWICLHHPENIAFGILAISQPTDSGNRYLWDSYYASTRLGFLQIVIKGRHIHCADISDHRQFVSRSRTPARQQPTVDSRLAVRSGLDQ